MQLFDEFAVGLRSVLALGVVLGALLYAVTILHPPCRPPIPVCPITFGKAGARLQPRKRHSLLALILPLLVLVRHQRPLFSLEEEDLSNAFIGVDFGRQWSGIRDLECDEAFPLGLEGRDVGDDAAAGVGRFADRDSDNVARYAEIFHGPGERE